RGHAPAAAGRGNPRAGGAGPRAARIAAGRLGPGQPRRHAGAPGLARVPGLPARGSGAGARGLSALAARAGHPRRTRPARSAARPAAPARTQAAGRRAGGGACGRTRRSGRAGGVALGTGGAAGVAVRAGAGRARRGLAEEACRAARGPALRRRGGRRTVRRGGLLDAPDLGLGVVALDLHPPHAEDAGPDPDPGTGAAHAGQGRIVHLLPHLAIVEAVALAAAEAGELADDAGHDRLVRTEVEEAPVLLHDLAAAFL